MNDTSLGNGALTYSIALLTADEVVLAGGYSEQNLSYYLYTGNIYWTMSPSFFAITTGFADVRSVENNGSADSSHYVGVGDPTGVRPVINLKPNSLKSGDGTALNPYTVELT